MLFDISDVAINERDSLKCLRNLIFDVDPAMKLWPSMAVSRSLSKHLLSNVSGIIYKSDGNYDLDYNLTTRNILKSLDSNVLSHLLTKPFQSFICKIKIKTQTIQASQ